MAKLNTTRAALFVEVNGKLHQALLTPQELTALVSIAAGLHGGELKVNETPIETIAFKIPEQEEVSK